MTLKFGIAGFPGSVLGVALFCAGLCPAAGIHIELTRGAGLNNRPGVRGPSIAARVTDDAGKPIAGALVIFTAPSSGASLDFGTGSSVQTSTDESGDASTPAARPAGGSGPVTIGVLVEKNGTVANATVSQMNFGESPAVNAGDMEIALEPEVKGPKGSGDKGDKKTVRVRVTDLSGKAVASARLVIRFYPANNTVLDLPAQSGSDGIAEFQIDAKLLKGAGEVPVTAVARNVTATRMLNLGSVAP